MNPKLRLPLRIAGALALVAGSYYLVSDVRTSFTNDDISPPERVGQYIVASRSHVTVSTASIALIAGGAVLIALSFMQRKRQP
jgi:hypothetical protein